MPLNTFKKIIKFYLSIYLTLFIQSQLFCQNKIYEIDSASISATNSLQKNSQTGRNIITIDGAQFNNLAINSIDELLKYTGGIEVQQRGPQGSQSDIMIRGGTYQQVLILLDGVRLNDPLTGHFNGNIPIHPNEISRIEILKGPASAIWGSDAVGGVIHIITKAFNQTNVGETKLNVGVQLGEYNLNNYNISATKKFKKSYFSIGLLSNNAEGESLRGTTGYFNNNTLHGSFNFKLKRDWTLSFKSIIDKRKFNAQNFYTTFISDTAKESISSNFNHLQFYKKKNNHVLSSDISYKTLRDDFQYNSRSPSNKNNTSQFLYQFNYQYQFNSKHSFNAGTQFLNKTISSNDRGNHQLANIGLWLVFKNEIFKNFFINESVRADWNDNYGLVFSPQINIAFTPKNWTFRTSFSKGIRDADFTERYNNYNKKFVSGGSIGNPNLNPEKTINLEFGVDYNFLKNIKISSTLFHRNQNNLIDWKITPFTQMPRNTNLSSTGTYALASNISNINTTGAEVDFVYIKNISKFQSLILNFNVTSLHSTNNDSIISFYISSNAKLLSTANIIYSFKNLIFSFNGLYKQRKPLEAKAINATISENYFILNSKISYRLLKEKLTIFAQVNNIFDTSYSDLLGSKMPGRWLSGGLNFTLN